MKNIIGIGVCFFSLLGLAAAQSEASVTFNLPSPAKVGSINLPAGHYTVREANSPGGSAILNFQGPNGLNKYVLALETTEADPSTADTHVMLKSEGESLRLEKIVIEGREFGLEVVQ
jgi:hypothetical protein